MTDRYAGRPMAETSAAAAGGKKPGATRRAPDEVRRLEAEVAQVEAEIKRLKESV